MAGGRDRIVGSRVANLIAQGANPLSSQTGAFVTEAHAELNGRQPVPGQPALAGGQEPVQRGNKWWTLVAVCLGTFMLLLDVTIVNVALPDIQQALHASFSDLQWVVDAYALTLAAFLLTAGSLADMYGRRRMYLRSEERRVGKECRP